MPETDDRLPADNADFAGMVGSTDKNELADDIHPVSVVPLSAANLPAANLLAKSSDAPSAADPVRKKAVQPRELSGVPEVVGWSVGLTVAHLAASLLLLAFAGYLLVVSGRWNALILGEIPLPPDLLLMLLGGDQMLVLLVTVLAVRWRLGSQFTHSLAVQRLTPFHAVVIAGLVLPLSCLSGALYLLAQSVWSNRVLPWLPSLALFDQFNTIEFLQGLQELASLPMLLTLLAVGPAVGEELIFRGVIGRGLLARWGLWGGVLATSLIFAGIHLHPVHVVAVIPLGIALHLVYLASRSIWAPMWLHFLNNAWATYWIATPPTSSRSAATVDGLGLPNLALVFASVVAIFVLGLLLCRHRTRFLLLDGSEWSPGYTSAEIPPQHIPTQVEYGSWTRRQLATAATAWGSFAVAFVAELTAFAR